MLKNTLIRYINANKTVKMLKGFMKDLARVGNKHLLKKKKLMSLILIISQKCKLLPKLSSRFVAVTQGLSFFE